MRRIYYLCFCLLLLSLISCNTGREAKVPVAINSLKTILSKQDSIIQFDHFIFIDSTEIYYVDKVQTSLEDIAVKIKEFKKANSNLKVQLEVDKSVKMNKLLVIMDACKKENIELKLKSR